MPRLAEFYGIVIAMFYNDHAPPHIHAVYGDRRASIGIAPVEVLEGELPRRALNLVMEWMAIHEVELTENWRRSRQRLPLVRVAPLD